MAYRSPVCREGEYSAFRVPVVHDVYDITDRIKEVDPRYFIMFNTTDQKYEIHVAGQPDTTFGCTLPFDQLDARALEYARKYSAARLQETIREMEANNARVEATRNKAEMDGASDRLREAIKYDDHHPSREVSEAGIPKEMLKL